MKSLLALIIFADGAAAFIGAILASRMRTAGDKRPAIAKILMVGLFGYSVARFWNAWNNVANGQEVFECVRLLSPGFLWNQYGALSLQAATAWGATIYLILMMLNGHAETLKSRCLEVIGKLRPWKR